jgi:predicted nucleic acid-binding protein
VRRVVVDASVAVKWFVEEVYTEAAQRLLGGDFEMLAPDLVRAEVGNVLWKKWRRDEIAAEAVGGILLDFERLPLRIETSEPLMATAWTVARLYERSFYDGLYVALARRAGCPLVTADRRLRNALRDGAYSDSVLWIEDVA